MFIFSVEKVIIYLDGSAAAAATVLKQRKVYTVRGRIQ